jgi:anti-sigma factor ChrR (cupin superfamily)
MTKRTTRPTDNEALDPYTIAKVAAALTPGVLEPELSARMRARVMASLSTPATDVVRAAEGEWKPLLPGVTVKTLRVDREQRTQTSLWRLAPGASIPRHPHSKDEECLVLEGEILHESKAYGAGDYLYARAGVRHSEFSAPNGALLMIRSELLPRAWQLWIAAHWPG